MEAVLPGEVEAARQALLSLRGMPDYGVNEVMRRCIPILGFRRSDGFYLLPETEIARLMGVDPKTANRFMRRGQGYEREGNLKAAAAALEACCRVIDFVKTLPEVHGRNNFSYFSDDGEIERFFREADAFGLYLASIPLQPWLPLNSYPGGENGVAIFGQATFDAFSPLKWGGLFEKTAFDHNCSLIFKDPLDVVTEKFDGTSGQFYASFGVELNGNSAHFELCIVSNRGVTLFRKAVYVLNTSIRFSPILIQIDGVNVKGSKTITALLTKDGRVLWRKTLRVQSAFDALYDSMFPEMHRWAGHGQFYTRLQRLRRSLNQVGSRFVLRLLLRVGVVSKSHLRNRMRILRRLFGPRHRQHVLMFRV
jgi:hypothetical protein